MTRKGKEFDKEFKGDMIAFIAVRLSQYLFTTIGHLTSFDQDEDVSVQEKLMKMLKNYLMEQKLFS